MRKMTLSLQVMVFLAMVWLQGAYADPGQIFKTTRVNAQVYALVGELGQRSPDNLGDNITCGFIIADDGVVVIDTGGSQAGAKAIVSAIRKITDKPIRWAINSGGQDHRWLGNDYFHNVVGAKIIAASAGKKDMQARLYQLVESAHSHVGKRFAGTKPDFPDTTFADHYRLPMQGMDIELIYTGGAHTHGDLLVWLPKDKIVFSGDTVFADRLLGIQPGLGLQWIRALEKLRDGLHPTTVIPGHGNVASLQKAMDDSLGYLVMLRDGARKLIDEGAFDSVEVAEKLDQSKFSYLKNYSDSRFRSENAIRMADEVFAQLGQ